jgi:hypothetical protein
MRKQLIQLLGGIPRERVDALLALQRRREDEDALRMEEWASDKEKANFYLGLWSAHGMSIRAIERLLK